MLTCIKQHLSNIWTEFELKKALLIKKAYIVIRIQVLGGLWIISPNHYFMSYIWRQHYGIFKLLFGKLVHLAVMIISMYLYIYIYLFLYIIYIYIYMYIYNIYICNIYIYIYKIYIYNIYMYIYIYICTYR